MLDNNEQVWLFILCCLKLKHTRIELNWMNVEVRTDTKSRYWLSPMEFEQTWMRMHCVHFKTCFWKQKYSIKLDFLHNQSRLAHMETCWIKGERTHHGVKDMMSTVRQRWGGPLRHVSVSDASSVCVCVCVQWKDQTKIHVSLAFYFAWTELALVTDRCVSQSKFL